MVVVDSQQCFDTEIGQVRVLRGVDSGGPGGRGGRGRGGGHLRGHRLMPLVLVPLALRVLPVTDQRAHLAEPFAAGLAGERLVLHVHVPAKQSRENV